MTTDKECLFVAAAPYEIVVLIVNTLIHHGMKPLYSVCVSSFVQSAVIIVSALLTVVFLTRRDRKKQICRRATANKKGKQAGEFIFQFV